MLKDALLIMGTDQNQWHPLREMVNNIDDEAIADSVSQWANLSRDADAACW